MRYRALAGLTLLFSSIGLAQWQQVAVPVSSDLFSIDSFDAQRLCVGTTGSWLRSQDGGDTWEEVPLADPVQGVLVGSTFHALRYQSETTLLGTGFFFLTTYPFQVRRSTNGGTTWPLVYDALGNGQFNGMWGMAFSGANGVAVGDLGRILRTTNSGANWTQISSSGLNLFDVAWAGSSTVVVVGENTIRRSTNSGQSWSDVWDGGPVLRAVSFPTPTVGFAAGSGGTLLRTNDGGTTWNPVAMQFPGTFPNVSDLWFVSENEGYAAAGQRILRTTNGGIHWSWYPAGEEVRKLHFRNANNGYAVGNNGLLLRTAAGAYRPYAVIGGPANSVCHNVPVTFTDQSGAGLSRQWLVNGQPVGTDPTLTWTFTEPQQTVTVALVVDNGTHTDTLQRSISVGASLAVVNNATVQSSTLCSGLSTNVVVTGSQQGTTYQLRRGTAAQGSAAFGNGGTLTFPTGFITAPTVFHMVATRNLGNCGTSVDTVSFNITLGNPLNNLTVTPGAITRCMGDSLLIEVQGTQLNVNYQLRRNGVNQGTPQAGNGGTISYPLGPQMASATYTVFATNTQLGCTSTLLQTVPLAIQELRLNWGPDAMNPIVGTPVHLMNGTNVPQTAFEWTIPGGIPSTSSAAEVPGVVFPMPGTFPVKLVGVTPLGCTDTLVQVIRSVVEPIPQACGVSQLAVRAANPRDGAVALDGQGNMFGFFHVDNAQAVVAFSGSADTLYEALPNAADYGHNGVLMKFDAQGMPQWVVNLWHNSVSARHADVEVDEAGNVYAAYFHRESSDSLRIVDVSGMRTTINPPHGSAGGTTQYSVVVTSFTPQGRLRWVNTFMQNLQDVEHVITELDGLGNLWVTTGSRLVKYARDNGTQLLQILQSQGFQDITITPTNEVWATALANMVMRKYSNTGALLVTTPSITPTPPPFGLTRLNGWQATRDPAGNIYQLHNIQGQVVLGGDTLTGPGTTTSNQYYVYFLTRRGPAGEVLWTRTIEMDGQIQAQGMVATAERMHLLVRFNSNDTLRMQGLAPQPFGSHDVWMLSYDLNGGTPYSFPVYTRLNANLGAPTPNRNSLVISQDLQRMAMWVGFADTLTVGSDSAFRYTWNPTPVFSTRNYGLVYGDLECLLPGLPVAQAPPQAFFTAPVGNCLGQPIAFSDASLLGPTAWNWSFPGGTPSSSTEPDPVVTYPATGPYPVTLVVSNANGESLPYSAEVFVDICTGSPNADTLRAWNAWPVPAGEQLNVQGPAPSEGLLMDMQGREVWRGTVPASGTMDLGGLPPGAYLLLVDAARLRILKD